MKPRCLAAIAALLLLALSVVALVITSIQVFPRGLFMAAMMALSFVTVWEAFRRPGRVRTVLVVLAGGLLVGAIAVLVTGRVLAEAFVAVGLFWLSTVAAREPSGSTWRFPRPSDPRGQW